MGPFSAHHSVSVENQRCYWISGLVGPSSVSSWASWAVPCASWAILGPWWRSGAVWEPCLGRPGKLLGSS
eukprot:9475729-Pyramimonas_sp.AAC.1